MARRILFLDRDGVINVDDGFVGTVDRFRFTPGLFPFLRKAQDWGYKIIVTTNQSGVARGLYSLTDYTLLTQHMVQALHREGIQIEMVLACFLYKDAKEDIYRGESFWRKPCPGMIMEGAQRLSTNTKECAMIGDRDSDLQAAQAAGVEQCFLLSDKKVSAPAGVKVVKNFDEIFLRTYDF